MNRLHLSILNLMKKLNSDLKRNEILISSRRSYVYLDTSITGYANYRMCKNKIPLRPKDSKNGHSPLIISLGGVFYVGGRRRVQYYPKS